VPAVESLIDERQWHLLLLQRRHVSLANCRLAYARVLAAASGSGNDNRVNGELIERPV
jgi:hypothetical protein